MFDLPFLKENEFVIESEDELVRSFRVKDQKKLILPSELEYPFGVRSYLTWKEPSGVYTYLVIKFPNWDLPRGVVFKKTAGEHAGGLCSWCNSYGSSEELSFFSVAMSSKVSTGYLLCQDIGCLDKIEETCARAGKDPSEQIKMLYYRMGKLFENISGYKPDLE